MNNSDFLKKYNLMPANAGQLFDIMCPDKRRAVAGICTLDGKKTCGILFRANTTDPWYVDGDTSYFFKMIPYFDYTNNVIEFDIIDRPYHNNEFEFIEEDMTFELFDNVATSILKEVDPDGYNALMETKGKDQDENKE